MSNRLHAVGDGVVPETVQPLQHLVHRFELFGTNAADDFDAADMALIKAGHDVCHLLALFGQRNSDLAAINARALMADEFKLDQFLEIVGDIRAEIVTAGAQLAGRQF